MPTAVTVGPLRDRYAIDFDSDCDTTTEPEFGTRPILFINGTPYDGTYAEWTGQRQLTVQNTPRIPHDGLAHCVYDGLNPAIKGANGLPVLAFDVEAYSP